MPSANLAPAATVADPPGASERKPSIAARAATRCAEGYHALAVRYHRAVGRSPEVVEQREVERRDLWNKRHEKVSKYFREVRDTWGLRVFFRVGETKPTASGFMTPYDPVITRWYHHMELLKPTFWMQLPFRAATKLASGQTYSFSPFEGLYHSLLQRPMRAGTYRLLGTAYELTNPFRFVANIAAFWPLYELYDRLTYAAIAHKLEDSVQEYGPEYDEMIEYDVRYYDIRRALKAGYVVDPETGEKKPFGLKEARESAFKMTQALNGYTLFQANFAQELTPEERRAAIRGHFSVIAPAMATILEEGMMDRGPSFLFTGEIRPFTDEEKDSLIALQDEALTRWRMVRAYVNGYKEELDEIAKVPAAKRRLDSMLASSYVQLLLDIHKQGDITRQELMQAMQMNVEWELRLKMSKVMELVPLTNTPEGSRPMTMEDFQLKELEKIGLKARLKDSQ